MIGMGFAGNLELIEGNSNQGMLKGSVGGLRNKSFFVAV
jgi:hypothetical protein